ncbi:MAG: pectate lyase [Verrucomicrobiales bacterium]|nr:pectate lyase [Verrucomicrobiales bacterium]
MRTILFTTLLAATFFNADGKAADEPGETEVLAAMKRAATFYRNNLAVNGGYASQWPEDLSEGRTEGKESPTIISIQPPGTTTIGLSLLRAYRATGDPLFLTQAKEAAACLVQSQLATGGWGSDFDFDPEKQKRYHLRSDLLKGDTERGKRSDYSTLDDNKTQSAMQFLVELVNTPDADVSEEIREALEYAWDRLIHYQAPNGAWPQQYSSVSAYSDAPVIPVSMPDSYPPKHPKESYVHFYTLNDNNLLNVVKLLLRAYKLEGDVRYLDSAKRCGEFLFLAQHTGSQRGWSQQYNHEMVPVWARKFEPPAVSSAETMGAVEALFELWVATGESRFIETVSDALKWLEESRLEDGQWARFYELKTNRPLYCEAETYKVTYDGTNTPGHYGFKISSSLRKKIDLIRKELKKDPANIMRSRTRPYSPEEWEKRSRELKGKVRSAMKAQTEKGYWLNDDEIDARLFSKNMNPMADYIEALRKAEAGEPSLRN